MRKDLEIQLKVARKDIDLYLKAIKELGNTVHTLSVQNDKFRSILELIAAPKRCDGTFNRCRGACQKLAEEVLKNEPK